MPNKVFIGLEAGSPVLAEESGGLLIAPIVPFVEDFLTSADIHSLYNLVIAGRMFPAERIVVDPIAKTIRSAYQSVVHEFTFDSIVLCRGENVVFEGYENAQAPTSMKTILKFAIEPIKRQNLKRPMNYLQQRTRAVKEFTLKHLRDHLPKIRKPSNIVKMDFTYQERKFLLTFSRQNNEELLIYRRFRKNKIYHKDMKMERSARIFNQVEVRTVLPPSEWRVKDFELIRDMLHQVFKRQFLLGTQLLSYTGISFHGVHKDMERWLEQYPDIKIMGEQKNEKI